MEAGVALCYAAQDDDRVIYARLVDIHLEAKKLNLISSVRTQQVQLWMIKHAVQHFCAAFPLSNVKEAQDHCVQNIPSQPYAHLLEAALKCCVLLDVLPVLCLAR